MLGVSNTIREDVFYTDDMQRPSDNYNLRSTDLSLRCNVPMQTVIPEPAETLPSQLVSLTVQSVFSIHLQYSGCTTNLNAVSLMTGSAEP